MSTYITKVKKKLVTSYLVKLITKINSHRTSQTMENKTCCVILINSLKFIQQMKRVTLILFKTDTFSLYSGPSQIFLGLLVHFIPRVKTLPVYLLNPLTTE